MDDNLTATEHDKQVSVNLTTPFTESNLSFFPGICLTKVIKASFVTS